MTEPDPDREERRRLQAEIADSLKESGALDEIFARIDAGEPLTGHEGLLKAMLKASLERGLEAELSDHVGYDRGDPAASEFENSRNGTFPKTVASEIGDIELAVPRDRNGTFTPMLVPRGVRRLDGLDAMIVSLYAGGMTIRDLDAQREHWESTLSANADMYGLEPSESAVAATTVFGENDVSELLELGAGQGRDTLFLASRGVAVTALDYMDTAFTTIGTKAAESGATVSCVTHDVREPLPFPDESFDACYSHMLFCMALTTAELERLISQVRRVLRPGGLVTYTARTTDDAHFGAGIDRGDDMYENGGFIVHFFGPELVEHLADGFEIVEQFNFEEAGLPRRLVSVTMRKR